MKTSDWLAILIPVLFLCLIVLERSESKAKDLRIQELEAQIERCVCQEVVQW